MRTINEINEMLKEIEESDFEIEEIYLYGEKHNIIPLFRQALKCYNAICCLEDVTGNEKKLIGNKLDNIMINKLLQLNSSLSKQTLNNIIVSYKRGFIKYPMDTIVIDDAVFTKEGDFDDFGQIFEIETFMFDDMKPYYNVARLCFTFNEDDLLLSPGISLRKYEEMDISKFISDSINSICEEYITKPLYELNTDEVNYGYKGLTYTQAPVEVYINMDFDDIATNLKHKKECDIKFCVLRREDVTQYIVHQSFKDKKPVWELVNVNNDVWRLTEAVLKNKDKGTRKL